MRALILLGVGLVCVAAGVIILRRGPALPARVGTGRVERRWLAEADRVRFSADALFDASPQLSARQALSTRQREGLIAGTVALVVAAVLNLRATGIVVVAVCTLAYAVSMGVRVWLFLISLGGAEMVSVPDAEACGAPDDVLHNYTLLVPAFHEPEVMAPLVVNLRRLDYPVGRLQVLLLLEADDEATIRAARMAIGPAHDISMKTIRRQVVRRFGAAIVALVVYAGAAPTAVASPVSTTAPVPVSTTASAVGPGSTSSAGTSTSGALTSSTTTATATSTTPSVPGASGLAVGSGNLSPDAAAGTLAGGGSSFAGIEMDQWTDDVSSLSPPIEISRFSFGGGSSLRS